MLIEKIDRRRIAQQPTTNHVCWPDDHRVPRFGLHHHRSGSEHFAPRVVGNLLAFLQDQFPGQNMETIQGNRSWPLDPETTPKSPTALKKITTVCICCRLCNPAKPSINGLATVCQEFWNHDWSRSDDSVLNPIIFTSTITPLFFLVNPDMFNSKMLVFGLFIPQNMNHMFILVEPCKTP